MDNKVSREGTGVHMFTTWMEVHLGLFGLGVDDDSDEEDDTPHKIRKFRSPLHAWDMLHSNVIWNIWVERCRVVIGGNQLSIRSILYSF